MIKNSWFCKWSYDDNDDYFDVDDANCMMPMITCTII